MWLLLGLFFAAATATAITGELKCPRAASAAGSQCGRAADADQASDDVSMLSVDHRSLLSSGHRRYSYDCLCKARQTEEASEEAFTAYRSLGCEQMTSGYCGTWVWYDGCAVCCTTPEEDSGECRQASNPEQAATGTVDYGSIVNILPSLSSAPVPPVNGFMAKGCVGDIHAVDISDEAGYLENSPAFRSLFFTGVTSCKQAQGFYFRAPPNSGRGGCIKYGDDVVIAQTADAAKNQCGWFGCRVAGMQEVFPAGSGVPPAVMAFDHGGDAPTSFHLQPPVGSGRSGCIQKGDDVVIAQTVSIVKTPNCGWYGCRVAVTNTQSGYMSLFFDHGGEAPPTFVLTAAPSR